MGDPAPERAGLASSHPPLPPRPSSRAVALRERLQEVGVGERRRAVRPPLPPFPLQDGARRDSDGLRDFVEAEAGGESKRACRT